MRLLVHKIASWILKRRLEQIEHFVRHPHATQHIHFQRLISRAKNTEWGKSFGYEDIRSIDEFRRRVPINTYESIYPWIKRSFDGEANVLWPGKRQWFAKSSGTTNDKSKYIPITQESLDECHFKAGQDMLSMYFHNKPDSKLFSGKALSIGGSHNINVHQKNIRYGDLSPSFMSLVGHPEKP